MAFFLLPKTARLAGARPHNLGRPKRDKCGRVTAANEQRKSDCQIIYSERILPAIEAVRVNSACTDSTNKKKQKLDIKNKTKVKGWDSLGGGIA